MDSLLKYVLSTVWVQGGIVFQSFSQRICIANASANSNALTLEGPGWGGYKWINNLKPVFSGGGKLSARRTSTYISQGHTGVSTLRKHLDSNSDAKEEKNLRASSLGDQSIITSNSIYALRPFTFDALREYLDSDVEEPQEDDDLGEEGRSISSPTPRNGNKSSGRNGIIILIQLLRENTPRSREPQSLYIISLKLSNGKVRGVIHKNLLFSLLILVPNDIGLLSLQVLPRRTVRTHTENATGEGEGATAPWPRLWCYSACRGPERMWWEEVWI
ncbi:hypothetical protein BDN70DRAFT_891187 [Pholiota conissans]|uniref:Uncharacterized protein n=1 Tax=Pholiota conissans TaxID=109636 RepID=A0A9P5ZB52_9AGAR|nr:hypothetical protein BDN70DRAFT_891187 [Pholiota conissans]